MTGAAPLRPEPRAEAGLDPDAPEAFVAAFVPRVMNRARTSGLTIDVVQLVGARPADSDRPIARVAPSDHPGIPHSSIPARAAVHAELTGTHEDLARHIALFGLPRMSSSVLVGFYATDLLADVKKASPRMNAIDALRDRLSTGLGEPLLTLDVGASPHGDVVGVAWVAFRPDGSAGGTTGIESANGANGGGVHG